MTTITVLESQTPRMLNRWVPRATAFLAFLACWLFAHPYMGVIHDAKYYSVQALRHIYPEKFSADLFFLHGSQESFTIFSRLWSPLIVLWGLGPAAMILTLAAHCVWGWGAFRLTRVLFERQVDRHLALAAILILPSAYGAADILRYGEGFLTPRVFVEALILHSLSWAASGRTLLPLLVLGISTLLHPLYGITGIALMWVYLCFRDQRWMLWGAAAALAVVGLSVAGVPPLDGLLRTYDQEWLSLIRWRNPMVLPTEWETSAWTTIALQFALIVGAATWSQGPTRRLMQSVLIASGAYLLITIVGVGWLKNVLATQLQVWRGLWILAAFANISTGLLICTLWRESPNRVSLIFLLVASRCWLPFPEICVPLLAVATGSVVWQRMHPLQTASRALHRVAIATIVLTAGCILALDIAIMRQPHDFDGVFGELLNLQDRFRVWELFLLGLVLFAWIRWKSVSMPTLSLLMAGAAVIFTAVTWDHRSSWRQLIETNHHSFIPFESVLRENEQVLWVDGIAETWFLLRRPSYFSIEQAAGLLFSRETAMEFKARQSQMRLLSLSGTQNLSLSFRQARFPPIVTAESLGLTCQAATGLDTIISAVSVPGKSRLTWRAPVSKKIRYWTGTEWEWETQSDFYLYRCSDFR